MPQLDFATYIPQMFWFFVSFSVFLFVVSSVVFPRIDKIFSKRHEALESTLEAVNEFKVLIKRAQADLLKQERHLLQSIASIEASDTMEIARLEAKMVEDSKDMIRRLELASVEEMEKATMAYSKEMKEVSAIVAKTTVEKVLSSMNGSDVEADKDNVYM